MATRRPKVPRAAAGTPKAADPQHADPAGGDVIRADFGAPRHAPGAAGPTHDGGHSAGHDGGPRGAEPPARTPGRPAAAPHGAARAVAGSAGAFSTAPGASGAASGPRAGTATAAPAEPGTADELDPVPAKAFSGRLLALGLVMIAITIMLAPTVRIFVEKRAEIAELQADIEARQAQQTDLKRQVSRWQDPNYVKQQARDRINMVMPGETGYWVYGSDLPAATSGAGAAAGSAQDPANLPWVDSLWDSIRRSATD
ncbi:FtsB family cell division protein [Arthrobacter sp. Soil763]|uniref:FtsB family cell division protein n=1 Tax=Arthrobacter sp. Soil763 TaxID=1736402 RepID=UPI0006FD95FB|nr:septum formation initiator family protein [Arthrobacter sp. Soil763]KRE77322.1 septation ring formation regulator EzrA [Arthrobacter sp. Soil763]